MRVSAAALCLIPALALTSCASSSRSGQTALTILAVNQSVGRAVFRLDCAPAGGDMPDPAKACAALASTPALITNPKPFTCAGGTFSWWDIKITGRLHGRSVRTSTSTCWTPQMAMLGRLGLGPWGVLKHHLVPRRERNLNGVERRTFAAGTLRPGDVVTCDIRGHHLEAGVPEITGQTERTGYGGKNIVSVRLALLRHADGSVTADCGVGNA